MSTTDTARYNTAYLLAHAADDAWHAALIDRYGAANAGDARYDAKRNRATPELVRLHAIRESAIAAWHQEIAYLRSR